MIKPKVLKAGQLIRLISPASALAGLVSRRAIRAKSILESLGFRAEFSPLALNIAGYYSASGKERAREINEAFADPDVSAILSLIGGYHCNQVLPYLDLDLIARSPKILCGYSDLTVLQMALWSKLKMISFYGPAGMTQFAEYPEPLSFTIDNFIKAISDTSSLGKLPSSSFYTDEFLNWFDKSDEIRARTLKPNSGPVILRRGQASGRLLGGCLSSLLHLAGTQFWPDLEGAILILEVAEGAELSRGESISLIDMHLADLNNLGVFDKISGIAFGRLFNTPEEETQKIFNLLLEYTENQRLPVLANLDFGHTDPVLTIPLGCQGTLNCINGSLNVLEPAFA